MKTIFLITKGTYSDYHVITGFSDEATAKKVAKQENAYVEELEIDEDDWKSQATKYSENDKSYLVWLSHHTSGEKLTVEGDYCLSYFTQEYENRNEVKFEDFVALKNSDFIKNNKRAQDYYSQLKWRLSILVVSNNQEDAIKKATEKFQEFIATRAMDGKPIERGTSVNE